jgi:hypothetical protein
LAACVVAPTLNALGRRRELRSGDEAERGILPAGRSRPLGDEDIPVLIAGLTECANVGGIAAGNGSLHRRVQRLTDATERIR